MKDHDIRETVDRVTQVAREFHATQQLRERVRLAMAPLIDSTRELRAAALTVIERWDSPLWKSLPHTSDYIAPLRRAAVADHGLTSTPVVDQIPPEVRLNAGAALHEGALAAVSMLMDSDPALGTPVGDALLRLADAIGVYERATLPPPFGDAPSF